MRQVEDPDILRILENVGRIRNEKGISVLELVKRTGISHSHLYYLEAKKVTPSIRTLLTLARGLEVSVKDFFD